MLKAAIYILTQNTPERKIYLKTCLYFLFKNFNSKYKYPVIILHEGDYDNNSKNEILLSIRGECKDIVKFQELDKNDFKVPEHINKLKMEKCINVKPVPYWRNDKYRIMCNFWIKHFFKYCKEYDYVMRIDDDSIIEEPITDDMFQIMKDKDLNYISNIVHIDCSICNYGMKDFFESIYPNKKEKIKELFMEHKLDNTSKYFNKFKEIYSIINEKEYNETTIDMAMPLMYYNNFCITKPSLWNTKEIKNIINEIDKLGYIFYYRWGDAPLHTLIMTLYDNKKLSKFSFKYSKRLQREAFKDDNGNLHCFMPSTYDNNSCISKK
jgi:alpha 1,2-mannosyltransferase